MLKMQSKEMDKTIEEMNTGINKCDNVDFNRPTPKRVIQNFKQRLYFVVYRNDKYFEKLTL